MKFFFFKQKNPEDNFRQLKDNRHSREPTKRVLLLNEIRLQLSCSFLGLLLRQHPSQLWMKLPLHKIFWAKVIIIVTVEGPCTWTGHRTFPLFGCRIVNMHTNWSWYSSHSRCCWSWIQTKKKIKQTDRQTKLLWKSESFRSLRVWAAILQPELKPWHIFEELEGSELPNSHPSLSPKPEALSR